MLLCSTEVVLQGNSNCSRKKSGGWRDYSLKLGWRTFTKTPRWAKHSDQIKQVAVCEGDDIRSRGTTSNSFLMFSSSCLCKCSCPFRGWSPHVWFAAVLSFWLSPLFSLLMSLSECESLGYQCSAADRKHMINKLSCFSSPLYPPSFFLKWGLPLLPMTPPQHIIPLFPLPSLLCCRLPWIAGSHRCVTIITRTFRGKK